MAEDGYNVCSSVVNGTAQLRAGYGLFRGREPTHFDVDSMTSLWVGCLVMINELLLPCVLVSSHSPLAFPLGSWEGFAQGCGGYAVRSRLVL